MEEAVHQNLIQVGVDQLFRQPGEVKVDATKWSDRADAPRLEVVHG